MDAAVRAHTSDVGTGFQGAARHATWRWRPGRYARQARPHRGSQAVAPRRRKTAQDTALARDAQPQPARTPRQCRRRGVLGQRHLCQVVGHPAQRRHSLLCGTVPRHQPHHDPEPLQRRCPRRQRWWCVQGWHVPLRELFQLPRRDHGSVL